MKCHGARAGAEITRPHVGHSPPAPIDVGFQKRLQSSHQGTANETTPFNRALASAQFPDNLEELGRAARDTVRDYREYVALIYVDVIEFEGEHVRKFYGDMPNRFLNLLKEEGVTEAIQGRLRPGVSPVSALLMTTRIRGRVALRMSICSQRTVEKDIDVTFEAIAAAGRKVVAMAIGELPASLREAAHLRFVQEISYPAMARMLSITPL